MIYTITDRIQAALLRAYHDGRRDEALPRTGGVARGLTAVADMTDHHMERLLRPPEFEMERTNQAVAKEWATEIVATLETAARWTKAAP